MVAFSGSVCFLPWQQLTSPARIIAEKQYKNQNKPLQMEHRLFFNKWLYRRLPYFLRRRLTPQQAPFVLVVLLAAFVILLQLVMMFSHNDEIEALEQKLKTLQTSKPHRRPLAQIIGIDPNHRRFYVPSSQGTFICLDSNQEIPFDQVNDDFCDCQNGSDEPATGACQNSKFYCTTPR